MSARTKRHRPAGRWGGVAGALLLAAAAAWNGPLTAQRRARGLSSAAAPEGTPPLLAVTTVALGGFRGLLVDAMWIRIGRLQAEGRFFEIVQLANWITRLEPRSSAVWAYHAWNLAYNVGGLMPSPDDRWRWVRHGIALLRDEGLSLNPGDSRLYAELCWLYQDKIGSMTDPAHRTYKRRLAEAVERFLPDGRLDRLDESRRAAFREAWKMDPERMRILEEDIGPLDWRGPFAHATYWAFAGQPYAEDDPTGELHRLMRHGLLLLCTEGRVALSDDRATLLLLPDSSKLDPAHERLDRLVRDPDRGSAYTDAYVYFLEQAVFLAAELESREEAQRWFAALRSAEGSAPDPDLDAFLVRYKTELAADPYRPLVLAGIEGALRRRAAALAASDGETAARAAREAAAWRETFMASLRDPSFQRKTGLPPLAEINRLLDLPGL
jgi:hypothetical protein